MQADFFEPQPPASLPEQSARRRVFLYDGEARRWREINDEETRPALAREVEAGRLAVSPDWQQQL
jgi:hypothetical protein